MIWAVVMLAVAMPATQPSPPRYRCAATTMPVTIDGKLDDAAWAAAEWTRDFVDIAGGDRPAPPLRTRAKLLWDERFLYVAAEMQETDVRATMRERDMPLYREGALELFLDPDGDGRDYLELEVNALASVFDLVMDKPYREGGKSDAAFDIDDLKAAVALDGTLNDDSDRDRGWTVELAIPWLGLGRVATGGAPQPGARWRVELGRAPGRPDGRFTTWSPHGRDDMHMPDKWGLVEFAKLAR